MTTRRPDRMLSAPSTQGLGALDLDRASSMADEGGASAAAVEARADDHFVEGLPRERGGLPPWRSVILLIAGGFCLLAGWKLRTTALARLKKAGPGA